MEWINTRIMDGNLSTDAVVIVVHQYTECQASYCSITDYLTTVCMCVCGGGRGGDFLLVGFQPPS